MHRCWFDFIPISINDVLALILPVSRISDMVKPPFLEMQIQHQLDWLFAIVALDGNAE